MIFFKNHEINGLIRVSFAPSSNWTTISEHFRVFVYLNAELIGFQTKACKDYLVQPIFLSISRDYLSTYKIYLIGCCFVCLNENLFTDRQTNKQYCYFEFILSFAMQNIITIIITLMGRIPSDNLF